MRVSPADAFDAMWAIALILLVLVFLLRAILLRRPMREVLEITGLNTIFTLVLTANDAVARIQSGL